MYDYSRGLLYNTIYQHCVVAYESVRIVQFAAEIVSVEDEGAICFDVIGEDLLERLDLGTCETVRGVGVI